MSALKIEWNCTLIIRTSRLKDIDIKIMYNSDNFTYHHFRFQISSRMQYDIGAKVKAIHAYLHDKHTI